MDYLHVILQLSYLLLLICKARDCYSIRCTGELTLDQEVIAMGSNLTVRCRSDTTQCGRLFVIQLDKQKVLEKTSCSMVTAQIVVSRPRSALRCMVQKHVVCGRDIEVELILSTPVIKEIVFAKDSLFPSIHWQTSDKMDLLEPNLWFRTTHGASDWMKGNVTELHRGKLLMLEDLEPWMSYEFKLRVCTIALKHNCSLWSQPVNQTSPRQAPLRKLDVWRIIRRNNGIHTQNVTVLWKAFTSEDYEGELQSYELIYQQNGTIHTLNFSVAVTQHSLQLPLEVNQLNVSAITSAGRSSPAAVSLIYTGTAPCTHYNISLYVENTEGVSDPTFGQIDSKGQKVDDLPQTILPPMMSSSQLASTGLKDGMVIGISLMTAVPLIIIAHLIYMKCVRQRIRKVCMSVGPAWLFEELPELGDSNAIKLLKDERCGSDLCWQQVDNDPPLSPVEDFSPSVERKNSYPIVHTEDPLEETQAEQDWEVCPYKPQLEFVSQRLVAVSEAVEKEDDVHPWLFPSPVFTKFDEVFFPSQGIHRSLNGCLTVDGVPVSVAVDGLFLSQTSLEENMWRVQGDAIFRDTGNGDQITDQW